MGFGSAAAILMTAGMLRVSFMRYLIINVVVALLGRFCGRHRYYFGKSLTTSQGISDRVHYRAHRVVSSWTPILSTRLAKVMVNGKPSALFVCYPAHNEERYIGETLSRIAHRIILRRATKPLSLKRLDRRDENDCTQYISRAHEFFTRIREGHPWQRTSALATCRLIPTGSSFLDA